MIHSETFPHIMRALMNRSILYPNLRTQAGKHRWLHSEKASVGPLRNYNLKFVKVFKCHSRRSGQPVILVPEVIPVKAGNTSFLRKQKSRFRIKCGMTSSVSSP